MSQVEGAGDVLELLDWKRRIGAAYAEVRAAAEALSAWRRWREVRDDLFANHAQSPLLAEARASFEGLTYYEYDRAARALATIVPADRGRVEIATSGSGTYEFTRFGRAEFSLLGAGLALDLYWLENYGGGMFVPFRDATSGSETYGAGRYLLDTVKGADLGTEDGKLVLDFNFAYNPSCAYDPRWVCPLAPPGSRLSVPVRAGERSMTAPA